MNNKIWIFWRQTPIAGLTSRYSHFHKGGQPGEDWRFRAEFEKGNPKIRRFINKTRPLGSSSPASMTNLSANYHS